MARGTPEDWAARDFYAILGVPAGASQDQIVRAYRRQARSTHPDFNAEDPGAETQFEELSAARDVLTDPDTRAAYDEARRARSGGDGPVSSGRTDAPTEPISGRRPARPSGATVRPGPVIWAPGAGSRPEGGRRPRRGQPW